MVEKRATGYVLIVGPDGAGKSTVLDALVEESDRTGTPTFRAHSRPHVIGGRQGVGTVTNPHGKPARGLAASGAKLAMVWADHTVGALTRWRRHRRVGLLIVERGWHDMLVDPRRYRLPERLSAWVRRLGLTLPRPDVTVLLSGDPEILHARKPEIGAQEVNRQIRRWREVVPTTATRCLEIDTSRTSPHAAAIRILGRLTDENQEWRRVPLTPERVGLQITGDARAGLGIYQPFSRKARLGARVGPHLIGVAGRPVAGPMLDLADLWDTVGRHPDGAVAMRSSTPGRHVLALCSNGRLESVLKVSAPGDQGLRQEVAMLTAPLRSDLPLRRPEVIWAGEWNHHLVLLTEIAHRSSSVSWDVGEVVPLVEALGSAGSDGRALVHGDLAPWNLIRTATGPVLLDWESARWADEPLHDLTHFVFQAGALLSAYSPETAYSILCSESSVGARLLTDRGESADSAPIHVRKYLKDAFFKEERARRYAARLGSLIDNSVDRGTKLTKTATP